MTGEPKTGKLVAVIDIGKTNAKLAFIDAHSGQEVWSAKRANEVVETPRLRQLDVAGIERWMIDALHDAPGKERVEAIVPVAHGASAVLLDEHDEILAAPDYEDVRFESVADAYQRVRDPFADTYSPNLPLGLNLGRQLFFLEQTQPELFARVAHIVPYPQFWAWRLSGVLASEVTSLGCHTDLWHPQRTSFTALAKSRRWSSLFPATRFAGDTLGTIRPELAKATGLSPRCRIVCGIHDSNASYLQYLLSRRDEPFAVISSGTWTVIMANLADLSRLDASRDMLTNVDAFGSPVCTARFMGGREYDMIAGSSDIPSLVDLERVLEQGAMALPAFAPGGPFADRRGSLQHAEGLGTAQRAALATLYASLMSDALLDALGVDGDVLIDGPLARNPLFGALLATWRPASRVFVETAGGGCSKAICFLAGFPDAPPRALTSVEALNSKLAQDYRRRWHEAVSST